MGWVFWGPAHQTAQQAARGKGSPTRGLPPIIIEGPIPSSTPIPWDSLSQDAGFSVESDASIIQIGSFLVGSRPCFFFPGCLAAHNFRPIRPQGSHAGVLPAICEGSTFGSFSCCCPVVQIAIQRTDLMGRSIVPCHKGAVEIGDMSHDFISHYFLTFMHTSGFRLILNLSKLDILFPNYAWRTSLLSFRVVTGVGG